MEKYAKAGHWSTIVDDLVAVETGSVTSYTQQWLDKHVTIDDDAMTSRSDSAGAVCRCLCGCDGISCTGDEIDELRVCSCW